MTEPIKDDFLWQLTAELTESGPSYDLEPGTALERIMPPKEYFTVIAQDLIDIGTKMLLTLLEENWFEETGSNANDDIDNDELELNEAISFE